MARVITGEGLPSGRVIFRGEIYQYRKTRQGVMPVKIK